MRKGIKVAKPGKSITSSPEDLYVDSDTPILKIALKGEGSVVFTAADVGVSKTVVVEHFLGYIPHHAIYAETVPGSGNARLVSASPVSLTTDVVSITAATTKNSMVIRFTDLTLFNPAGSYHYIYQIYHDAA